MFRTSLRPLTKQLSFLFHAVQASASFHWPQKPRYVSSQIMLRLFTQLDF